MDRRPVLTTWTAGGPNYLDGGSVATPHVPIIHPGRGPGQTNRSGGGSETSIENQVPKPNPRNRPCQVAQVPKTGPRRSVVLSKAAVGGRREESGMVWTPR